MSDFCKPELVVFNKTLLKDSEYKAEINFDTCKALKDVTGIGSGAFCESNYLSRLNLPERIDYIGDFAFYKSGLKELSFSYNENLKLGEKFVSHCPNLERITIKRVPFTEDTLEKIIAQSIILNQNQRRFES